MSKTSRIDVAQPLKPVWFQMMLTLASGPVHGYGIRREVEKRTGGQIRLWPTTLYGALARMEESGLIEEVAPPEEAGDEVERIYYRLTEFGREVLLEETSRLEALVRLSRARMATS